jgi:hypothetical protein
MVSMKISKELRSLNATGPPEIKAQVPSRRQVSLKRPSLEYQHAFDLCAEAVHMRSLAPVLVATSLFYVRELTKRLGDCQTKLILIPSGTKDEAWSCEICGTTREAIKYWLESEADLPISVATLSNFEADIKTRAVVWAEPEPQSQARILGAIRRILLPGGRLYVITSNGLAGILPEWQSPDVKRTLNMARQPRLARQPWLAHPAQHPAGLRQTLAYLRKAGFARERLYGFRGLSSIFWAGMYYVASYMGRQDWADRFHFKMRGEYVVQGIGALWTPVSVVYAYRLKSSTPTAAGAPTTAGADTGTVN